MKEYLIDLIPIKGGHRTKARVFAANSASARTVVKQMYPTYYSGLIKQVN